jgi:hypothetical protein
MTDQFCPEIGPSGAPCGVLATITHDKHFTRDGAVWRTPHLHSATVVSPVDWFWDKLGIDPERVSRAEFNILLNQYIARMNRSIHNPPQTLLPMTSDGPEFSTPMILRPCICCRCTGNAMCWHADEGGCCWDGPGR